MLKLKFIYKAPFKTQEKIKVPNKTKPNHKRAVIVIKDSKIG